MATFSPEQLNFFKFSTVVLDEFPIALRKVFVYMWDTLVASKHGGQKWDNSGTVLNLFLSNEGGAAKVPSLNQFIEQWDCTALFKATLFAKTFAMPDGSGGVATLHTLYVKSHSLPSGTFHLSVLSPSGNQAETFALALDQLRLLRNTLCHQISTQKIDKTTLDRYLSLAKEAFAALGQDSCKIDSIVNLGEEELPTARVQYLEDELNRERAAAIKFKQIEHHLDQIESVVKEVGSDVTEVKTGLADIGSDVTEVKTGLADIGSDVTEVKTGLADIGSDVTEVKTGLADIGSDVTEVKTGLADIGSDVTEVKTGLADIGSDVTEVKTGLADIGSDVTEVKTGLADIGSDVTEVKTGLADIGSDVTEVKTGLADIGSDVTEVKTGLADIGSDVTEVKTGLADIGSDVTEVKTGLADIGSDVTEVKTGLADIGSDVTEVKTGLADIGSDVTEVKTGLADIGSDVTEVKTGLADIGSDVTEVKTGLADIGSDVTEVKTGLADIGSDVTEVKTGLADVGSDVTEVKTGLADIGSDVTEVKTGLADIGSDVTEVKTGLADIGSDVTDMKTGLADIGSGVTEVKTGLADIGSDVTEVKTGLADIGSDVTEVKTGLADVGSDVTEVKTGLANVGTDVTEVKTGLANVGSDVTDMKTGLADIGSGVTEVKTGLANVGSDVTEVKTGLGDVGSEVKELKADVQDIKQAMQTENPVKSARLRLRFDCEIAPGPEPQRRATEMVLTSQAPQLSSQSPSEIPTSSGQPQSPVTGLAANLATVVSSQNDDITPQQVLSRIADKYIQIVNLSSREDLSEFLIYMKEMRKVLVVDKGLGSLMITVECGSLQILDELWEDYRTGHLNEMAQKLLVTEDILKEFNLLEVKLTTTILEEEYRACREYFVQFQELYPKEVENETTSEEETSKRMKLAFDEPLSIPDLSPSFETPLTSPAFSSLSELYPKQVETETTSEEGTSKRMKFVFPVPFNPFLSLSPGPWSQDRQTYKGMQLEGIFPQKCPIEGGPPFKLVYKESIPEELDSAMVEIGTNWVKVYKISALKLCFFGDKLPPGKPGFARVLVYSLDREHDLGETVIEYIDEKTEMVRIRRLRDSKRSLYSSLEKMSRLLKEEEQNDPS